MDDNKVIFKIKELKQIEPRQNWVVFTKSKILSNTFEQDNKLTYRGLIQNILNYSFKNKLAYSLAAFLFAIGILSFMGYNLLNKPNVQEVKVSPETLMAVKDNVEQLRVKSHDLAQVLTSKTKYIPVSLAVKEAKDAANELTKNIKQNPSLAKEVALEVNNNKTYLNIDSEDKKENDDIKDEDLKEVKEASDDLYKAVVTPLIEDFEKKEESKTLNEDQEKALKSVEDFFEKGKYSSALENLLLINSGNK